MKWFLGRVLLVVRTLHTLAYTIKVQLFPYKTNNFFRHVIRVTHAELLLFS